MVYTTKSSDKPTLVKYGIIVAKLCMVAIYEEKKIIYKKSKDSEKAI